MKLRSQHLACMIEAADVEVCGGLYFFINSTDPYSGLSDSCFTISSVHHKSHVLFRQMKKKRFQRGGFFPSSLLSDGDKVFYPVPARPKDRPVGWEEKVFLTLLCHKTSLFHSIE